MIADLKGIYQGIKLLTEITGVYNMPFITTDIPGLLVFEPKVFEDSRGYFFESYNEKNFNRQGIDTRFVQDNQSSSSIWRDKRIALPA